MSWTPERKAEAKKLYAIEGLSALETAKRLGGVTRNAVIGLAHREGWVRDQANASRHASAARAAANSRRPRPAPEQEPWKPPVVFGVVQGGKAASAPKPAPAPTRKAEALALAPTTNLIDLDAVTCKWPVGDPKSPDFGFCGRPAEGKKPYCAEHHFVSSDGLPKKVDTPNKLSRSLRRYV